MSENNNGNNGRGKNKDIFVKPGDENIVSGKSFFLSFGKTKKSSANPLIESEKNKQKKHEEHANGHSRPQNESAKDENNNNNGNNNSNANNGNGNNHNANNNNRNKKNFPNRPKNNNEYNGNRKNNNNNRPENAKNAKGESSVTPRQNVAEQTEKIKNKPHSEKNNDEKNKKTKFKDEKKVEKGTNRQKLAQKEKKEIIQQADEYIGEIRAAQKQAKELTQEKNAEKTAVERKHPKHKKEKFVPTATQSGEEEQLLQPIVNRTGIISGVSANSATRIGKQQQFSSLTETSTQEEPLYIDRNRPLAEQIAEQSKPKTYKKITSDSQDTVEVIGVRFREAGKIYYFAPAGNQIAKNTAVIVETARGVEYGFCAIANRKVSAEEIVPPLKPIIRIATAADSERYTENKRLEEDAAKVFRQKVRALGLDMSLVYVEYTFDNGKLLFYFTSEGRVDFRELIKELASAFRTRIELRQIGVRDEAKIVGGLGICGRPICCKSFLGEFSQVSIKMAKDQNLFINSSKISGTCGRFMCCIRYEDEVYQKEYERTPKIDSIVETPEGKGVVVESNVLKGIVKVLLDNKPDSVAKPFKCTEVKFLGYVEKENESEIPADMEVPEE